MTAKYNLFNIIVIIIIFNILNNNFKVKMINILKTKNKTIIKLLISRFFNLLNP